MTQQASIASTFCELCGEPAIGIVGGGAAAELGYCAKHPPCACGSIFLTRLGFTIEDTSTCPTAPSEADQIAHSRAQCRAEATFGKRRARVVEVIGWHDAGATDWVLA